ncbi:MAG: hypothetical protein L3J71_16630 [Victivallaceae bacterium]|nr:hypothetical protein [Victivallaceae bacterium]
MASITHHYNKKTGVTYVYSVESYWDKEKKAPRNKQVCLGKLDKTTGELLPSKRRKNIIERAVTVPGITATSRVAGPYITLEGITHKYRLGKLLKKCFPEDNELILSLIYFIVQKGIALSRSEPWSMTCLHPFAKLISSQSVSKLLQRLSECQRSVKMYHQWSN